MSYVSYSFNLLFLVEEALYWGAKDITASNHVTKKASDHTDQSKQLYSRR
jgi:hypothetical protein